MTYPASDWKPPSDWIRIETLEAHAAGEPLRIILNGWPEIPGNTISAKRRYAQDHHEALRKALMLEPRGHADMYGALITDAVTDDGDFGVLFLHNEGYSTMCGHGVIALVTAGLQTGWIRSSEDPAKIRLDTPAGRVTAHARLEAGRVEHVSFENVPSYVEALDQKVNVPGLGEVAYDLAFGGAYYAYCRAEDFGLQLVPSEADRCIELGRRIKAAVSAAVSLNHPEDPELSFLYGTIFCGEARSSSGHSRHVCVFADGEVDRSPTGTGVSARVALERARGNLTPSDVFHVESILGTTFTGSIAKELDYHGYRAVIPRVRGSAALTGRAEFWIDPRDPLREGFMLR